VLLRDPDKLDSELRPLVDVAVGDLSDQAYVIDATEGVDALLWVAPESFTAADPVADVARLAEVGAAAVRANGIGHVVLVSSVGAEVKHGAGLIDGLARNEEALTATGANLLILRNGYYFTNLLGNLDSLKEGTLPTIAAPDQPVPWVDPRDIGDVAAARLLAANWTGVEVRAVHGPADLTWNEAASIIGAAIGRDVELQLMKDDDMRGVLSGAGMTDAAVEGVVGMTAGLRDLTPEQARSYVTTTPTTLAAWVYANLRPLL
jgi:uncharacterized protein YbjT (DUF2867 family)